MFKVGNHVLDLVESKDSAERRVGLLGTTKLPKDGMILIFPENDEIIIHTVGMKYPIDVIFVAYGKIKSIHSLMPDTKISGFADMVIELELGKAEELDLEKGMSVSRIKPDLKQLATSFREGGKIQVIGEGGEVKKTIDDEVRIVSRKETKQLFELATRKTKKSNVELGKLMVKIINGQDNRPKDTVTVKKS